MREVVLDTETTGLDVSKGHKILEIGALELINLVPSGKTLHLYVNPERDIDDDATRIHGITNEFIANKPNFRRIVHEFLDFIGNDRLVIHNAPFDLGFLNAELNQVGLEMISEDRVVDTLTIARQKFPGAQASLDALCRRFQINNEHRDLHGALIDADLLASVYVELRGGLQPNFLFSKTATEISGNPASEDIYDSKWSNIKKTYRPPRNQELTEDEIDKHNKFLELITDPIWQSDLK